RYGVRKFAPGHVHDLLVELDEDDALYPEHAADYLRALLRRVDERDVHLLHQRIGVRVEGEDGGYRVQLRGTAFCHLHQRGVAAVDPIEEAQGYYSLSIRHSSYLKKALYRVQ